MDAGKLIAEARNRARITQTELAFRMGTHQSVIARWETGKTQPTLETVIKAVEATGLELTVTISGSNSRSHKTRHENVTDGMLQELRQVNADHARLTWIKGR
jgi:transcriptional regulator with XRE-family HTH domain